MYAIKSIIICLFLLSDILWAKEMQLNLPERFDAKIVKMKWFNSDGNKGEDDLSKKKDACSIVHFYQGKFKSFCKNKSSHFFSETNSMFRMYSTNKLSGTYTENGKIRGIYNSQSKHYNGLRLCPDERNEYLYMKVYNSGNVTGNIDHNSIKMIISFHKERIYDIKVNLDSSSNCFRLGKSWKLRNQTFQPLKYIFYLKIVPTSEADIQTIVSDNNIQNKSSSDNEFEIQPVPTEDTGNQNSSTPQQDKEATTPYTNEQETTSQPPPKQNPCTQKPIDDAWKEYCEAKAHNAKIREEEEAEAKAAEQEAKEEEAYQKRLDAWNEEERQSNIKFIKSQEAERKKAREIWEQEDKAFNESVAKEQAERKAKQAEIKKAHDIIDRFGDDYETQRAAHKKVEALAKSADTQKANKIKNAIRKQFYDSKQITLQAEAEYQASKAKELGKKAKYLNTVKDTSLTVNKVLARIDEAIDPLELGNKIVEFQENSYDAIESYSKGGLSKVVDDFVEKKANELSNDWAGVAKETIEKYKQYHSKKGLKLKPNEVYYDKEGKRLTRVNIYQRVYDKKGNEVSFSFGKRVFKKTFDKLNDDYNTIQGTAEHIKNIKEGVVSGDVNKVANEMLDMTEKEDEGEENKKEESNKRKDQ